MRSRFPVFGVMCAATLALVSCIMFAGDADARRVRLKMGSSAPEGTPWHDMILQMGEEWGKLSGGSIELKVYPGGILGDEPDMVKKLRIGQLQMVGVSAGGLALMDGSVMSLQVPMMYDSYEEFDYVRERLEPKIEAAMREKGFILLAWTDGGWIYFFTKERVSTWKDLSRQKLFVWAGDPLSLEMYTSAGFRPVPLALTDMLPGLQTGLINALDAPALAVLANQWFGIADHMIDVKWVPLLGGIVMSEAAWNRIPASQRDGVLKTARSACSKFSDDVRKMGPEAVLAMQKHGLKVIRVGAAEKAKWQAATDELQPLARQRFGGPELYDEVVRRRDAYRARKKN